MHYDSLGIIQYMYIILTDQRIVSLIQLQGRHSWDYHNLSSGTLRLSSSLTAQNRQSLPIDNESNKRVILVRRAEANRLDCLNPVEGSLALNHDERLCVY